MSRIQKKLNQISGDYFVYCDVGARGGVSTEWRRVADKLMIVAYEPEAEAAVALENSIIKEGFKAKVYKHAVWSDSGRYPFYEAKSGACSSLLLPNNKYIGNFSFSEKFSIIKKWEFEVSTIDETLVSDAIVIDFLKIDVQGGSLNVLEGASVALGSVIGLNLEAEFVSIYRDERLFGDIDKFVRNKGFLLIDLRPTYWRRRESCDVPGSKGELVYADLLYLIDPDVLYKRLSEVGYDERISLMVKVIRCCDTYALNEWVVNYIDCTRELFNDDPFSEIYRKAKKGKFIARLPEFKYRHFIGNVLKDIADQLHAPASRVISQDQGLAGLRRHFWFGKK